MSPGLPPCGGVCLPNLGRRRLIDRTDGHVLVAGPTRCGKGTTVLVPTLLDGWGGSVLAHDPKGELWQATAGARARHSHALLLDPCSRASVRINPLDEVRPGEAAVGDAQQLVGVLTGLGAEGPGRDHWRAAAHEWLVGLLLHLLHAEPLAGRTLGALRRLNAGGDDTARAVLAAAAHPTAARAAAQLLSTGGPPGAEAGERGAAYRGSVYNTAGVLLQLWEDPVVDWLTAASEVGLADLMCADNPVSLYLVVRPGDRERVLTLVQLLLVLAQRALMHDEARSRCGRAKRRRLLFLVDEAPDFAWPGLAAALRSMAGYGLKAVVAGQSLGDLEAAFGPGLVNNCATRVFFRPNADQEARRLSAMVGEAAVEEVGRSRSWRPWAPASETRGETVRPAERPVLPAWEAMGWPERRHAVILGRGRPVLADYVPYHAVPALARLLRPPPPGRASPALPYPDLPAPAAPPATQPAPPDASPAPAPAPPRAPAPPLFSAAGVAAPPTPRAGRPRVVR